MNTTPVGGAKGAGARGLFVCNQEVERKWIVNENELPDLAAIQGIEVRQGYLALSPDGTEVRLRQKGEKYLQTIKSDGGLVRAEVEIELTKGQFDNLWQTTVGRRLEKTRYEIAFKDVKIELDIFSGYLAGLVMAEVEFLSISDSKRFIAPDWFGKEVTEDNRFKNKNLALNGIPLLR
jgi:CYTH domain-containing protein